MWHSSLAGRQRGRGGVVPDTAPCRALLFGWPVNEWLALPSGAEGDPAWKAARHVVHAVSALAGAGAQAADVAEDAIAPTGHYAARRV
jgi:hypothetical protein